MSLNAFGGKASALSECGGRPQLLNCKAPSTAHGRSHEQGRFFSKKPDVKDTLEETDKRDCKVIGIFKMTVAADAKTAKASYDDKLQNRTIDFPNVTKQ